MVKVNIKEIERQLVEYGFEASFHDKNSQFVLKKNGVTFLFNPTKNTWTCSKLRVNGKGIANLFYVANNMLVVNNTPTKAHEISRVYYGMNKLQRFLSKRFYLNLLDSADSKDQPIL